LNTKGKQTKIVIGKQTRPESAKPPKVGYGEKSNVLAGKQ
jgi:hypothetical protein